MAKKVDFCERLYKFVMRKGKHTAESTGEREPDGNYVSGWHHDTTIAELRRNPYVLKATETLWRTYSLNTDMEGTKYCLEIYRGKKRIFQADRDGGRKSDSFAGADERYRGSSHEPSRLWEIAKGKLPPAYLKKSLS